MSHVPFKSELRAKFIVFVKAWPTILLLQALLQPRIGRWSRIAQVCFVP